MLPYQEPVRKPRVYKNLNEQLKFENDLLTQQREEHQRAKMNYREILREVKAINKNARTDQQKSDLAKARQARKFAGKEPDWAQRVLVHFDPNNNISHKPRGRQLDQ